MTVLLIFAIILISLISAWCILYYKYNRYLKQYPGPIPIPLFGHLLHFGKSKDFLYTLLGFQNYGPVMKTQMAFLPPIIQITDPKVIEELLSSSKNLRKGQEYKYLEPWLGQGLVTSEPVKWKHHRKVLTPAFHVQVQEQYIDTFNLYSEILVSKLEDYVAEDSFDIYPLISLCTLDIICASTMGTEVNALKDETSEYVKSVKSVSELVVKEVFSLIGMVRFLFSLTFDYQKQIKAIRTLHDYSKSVISSRKQLLQGNQSNWKSEDTNIGIKQRYVFLDTLLKYKLDGGAITDVEIREEGHDTTAGAIGFILFCLATNPEVQQKSVEELYGIFGNDKNRVATARDLHEMKYLEMVIKETLRLYPPAMILSRKLEQDTEFNGAVIPKNVTLRIFIFGLHRDPQIYSDPEKFDPDRFTPENQAKRSPYAYIPFSAGPRSCIGQKFAMNEMKVVVSKVLRTFELHPSIPAHRIVLQADLSLISASGVKLRLEKREW